MKEGIWCMCLIGRTSHKRFCQNHNAAERPRSGEQACSAKSYSEMYRISHWFLIEGRDYNFSNRRALLPTPQDPVEDSRNLNVPSTMSSSHTHLIPMGDVGTLNEYKAVQPPLTTSEIPFPFMTRPSGFVPIVSGTYTGEPKCSSPPGCLSHSW